MSTFRKGLKEWNSARDAFVDFTEAEHDKEEALEESQWLKSPQIQEPSTIAQLNEQVERLMAIAFGNIDKDIEHFYQLIEQNDERDFSRLDPLELERLILSLQKVIYIASDIVAERYNAAYWADRVQQDEYWIAYREPKSVKAKEDRQSHAMTKTRDERFEYYLKFMVWRRLSERLNALKDLLKTLEWYQQRNYKARY